MRILLLAVNSSWTQVCLSLHYLKEFLHDSPHEYKLVEITTKTHLMDALQEICSYNPDMLLLSVYIWNRPYLCALIPEIRKLLPEIRFVIGGPEAANQSLQSILRKSDITVCGSGEAAIVELLSNGFSAEGIYTAQRILPLVKIPFAYQHSDSSSLKKRLLYYESSRGCPFGCIYCLSANDLRGEQRFDASDPVSLQRMYAEIDALVKLMPRTIKFVDRSFNLYPKLARMIWEYVISLDCSCDFHFEIYPDLLQSDDLLILQKAPPDRIRFEIGIQSTNDGIMKIIKRSSNWEKSRQILLELVQSTNIRIHADLICALPTEDAASLIRSINDIALCFPHEIQLGMLKILPDTPMHDKALSDGYLWMSEPPYQVLRSDALTFEEICHFDEIAHIINLYWNKADFINVMKAITSQVEPYELFCQILAEHKQRGFATHSVDQFKRFEIVKELVTIRYQYPHITEALLLDWQKTGINPRPQF